MTESGSVGEPKPPLPTWVEGDGTVARTIGRPVRRFLHVEASGGIVLLAATILALIWANLSPDSYNDFWHTEIGIEIGSFEVREDLLHWVNDGLMAVFFFVVGLEIKREWDTGQLLDRRAAVLPAMAALGGMVLPALVFLAITFAGGGEGAIGWGIPMATDIAFALGIVALLGDRVPVALKVFLLTLAIVDDIGAIAVIAVFYSEALAWDWMGLAAVLIALAYVLRRNRVWYIPIYTGLAAVIWLAVLKSGVHATIAGVFLGIITPTRPLNPEISHEQIEDVLADESVDETTSALDAARMINESVPVGSRLIRSIHPWTSFVIVPIFALANAGIQLGGGALSDAATSSVTLGIAGGLIIGKIVGITGAVVLAVKLGIARLPAQSTMTHVVGVSALAGIGFTVSLFISGLAYDDPTTISNAKVGILAASVVAAVLGAAILVRAGGPDDVDLAESDAIRDRDESAVSP